MRFDRASGVFLHLTSLPGPHGIGDLGAGAREFLSFLQEAEQAYWQFCPLGPTSSAHGNSPYQSFSAFAGNPLLISLDRLVDDGWLTDEDLQPVPDFDEHSVDYDAVGEYKRDKLRTAHQRFRETATEEDRAALDEFRDDEPWVDDYALFRALKKKHEGVAWVDWPEPIRTRDPDALAEARDELSEEVEYRTLLQYWFDTQWQAFKNDAEEAGIELVGDVPIYVGLDSADVWSSPEAFQLDDQNRPTAVAGVPPNPGDDGQRWGNPLYDWERLADNDYDWWGRRLGRLFEQVDVTRLDHFQGFLEYWAIPFESDSPADGEWRDGPGADFFESIRDQLGELPFIAEDLGFPDAELQALMDRFEFPGMRVPQYADWCQGGNEHQPMNYPKNAVAYTSTHDTDTFAGYYNAMSDRQRECLHYNLGVDGSEINWSIIEAVWRSDAVLAFTTLQDLLGLDSHARFNTPGTLEGNWTWRVTSEGLDEGIATKLGTMTAIEIR
ncbi:MAG: 4-alpha-glucanotransferase [Euryarchaeota archaeon]|nr:4-alpha-glucanotransferase [Euryarchaeota archaeon]